MSHHHEHGAACGHIDKLTYSRRELLGHLGGGLAGLAFADFLGRDGLLAAPQQGIRPGVNPLAPKEPHRAGAKAKAVISIFCYGGVSQIDTFDPKPDLMKWQGEPMQGVGPVRTIMGNPRWPHAVAVVVQEIRPVGDGSLRAVPNIAQHVDDIAFVRSMYGISPAHGPALFQMNTGSILAGHPSVGSWVTYGLAA
jgi:hypothetical protein